MNPSRLPLPPVLRPESRSRAAWNPLRSLNAVRVVALLEAGERGEMAELQRTFRAVEKRNGVGRALIARRVAAILKRKWTVKVSAKLPGGATPEMAARQARTLSSWYQRIDNLQEALRHLAMAEFRGFAHLQIQTVDGTAAGWESVRRGPDRFRLYPVRQEHWVRDGTGLAWGWNPSGKSLGWEAIPAEHRADLRSWGLIVRECAWPIDELALVVFLSKSLSQRNWDAFVEVYGIPGGVVMMPPDVPAGREAEFEAAALAVAEGGSGALPHGAAYVSNSGPSGPNPFRERLRQLDAELILAGTGGTLTMLGERGSGTLAGKVHARGFEDIAAGEAAEISEVMQRQFDRPILEAEHPGEPHCAYWELPFIGAEDADRYVGRIARLAKIGLRVPASHAAEKTGLRLREATIENRRDGAGSTPSVEGSTSRLRSALRDLGRIPAPRRPGEPLPPGIIVGPTVPVTTQRRTISAEDREGRRIS